MILLSYLAVVVAAAGLQALLPFPAQGRGKLAFLGLAAVCATPYFALLLITQRPVLSALLSLVLLIIVWVINQAKYHALQEPVVYSDIYLYLLVLRFPRLYLPFLNIPLVFFTCLLGFTVIALVFWWEPRYTDSKSVIILGVAGLVSALVGLYRISQKLTWQSQPKVDIAEAGFYHALIQTFVASGGQQAQEQYDQALAQSPWSKMTTLNVKPNLIAIQSESFADLRRDYSLIKTAPYAAYDTVVANSAKHGSLTVPAWGANTLRPEMAFLTGVKNQALGLRRYHPYRYLSTPVPSLASTLKEQGYRTVAVHPNHPSFFNRDTAIPLLGFEEFITLGDIPETDKAGPYTSDAAVLAKIQTLLDQPLDDRPLFIFVITMENHGPLHLEKPEEDATQRYYNSADILAQHHDLSVYLKHIHNASTMLHRLCDFLTEHHPNSALCFYGDHVPSMPKVYAELGPPSGKTTYLLWQPKSDTSTAAEEIDIAYLATAWVAGL